MFKKTQCLTAEEAAMVLSCRISDLDKYLLPKRFDSEGNPLYSLKMLNNVLRKLKK